MLRNITFKLKVYLSRHIPILPVINRFLKAFIISIRKEKEIYSQHGEDKMLWDILKRDFPSDTYFYIDVGAFHPSLLSNTYKFYRRKMNGVVIEPNRELITLHRLFRARDIHLEIGCDSKNGLRKFNIQRYTPALSSLDPSENNNSHSQIIPVFTLDSICNDLNIEYVHLLSIDVEGNDLEVLKGAENTLEKTYLICIESNSLEFDSLIVEFLKKRNFKMIEKIACNLIFQKLNQ
ncbi:MAG: FkbM family methyltransferase [Saprospiraceae bacterium]